MNLNRYLLLVIFGLPISFVDFWSRRIPNQLVALLAIGGLLSYLAEPSAFLPAVICSILFAVILIPISLLRSGGLGAGDIKLIIVLALILGRGADILTALMVASLLGLVHIAAVAIFTRRVSRSIAFGPWLIVGALAAIH